MNRIFASLLLLLVVWDHGSAVRTTLRVVTYNIHHGEGTDGRLDLSRLAEVMRSVQPDLVALQEVDQGTERTSEVNEPVELERLMDMHGVFGKAMDYMGGGYGVAVLSRWPLLATHSYSLPHVDGREPRVALTVELEAGTRGPFLQFTCTHLDQARDPENRLAQAKYLNDLLVRDDGRPTLLAGDMNARPDTEVMGLLNERWLNPPTVDPSPIAPSGRPRLRIDYVLIRPAGSWRVIESRLIDDTVASDHRPLLVVLEWSGAD
jgi:endonuclease/exonuclease/phosphatase family metal-dependent hydrolase